MEDMMNTEYAVMYLVLRTLWATAGVFLGAYALVVVRKQWNAVNMTAKAMWWLQVALTPLSAGFALWITMAFLGSVWPIGWALLTVLIVGSFLAPANAFWLLVESQSTTKSTLSAV